MITALIATACSLAEAGIVLGTARWFYGWWRQWAEDHGYQLDQDGDWRKLRGSYDYRFIYRDMMFLGSLVAGIFWPLVFPLRFIHRVITFGHLTRGERAAKEAAAHQAQEKLEREVLGDLHR